MENKKILIVDDEEDILRVLDKKLTAAGYLVVKASTAQEAIDAAKVYLPHLILLDIVLPDMDGAEAVISLKAESQTANIPIVFLSGIASPEKIGDDSFGIKVGGRRFPAIAKPFVFEELLTQIQKIIG